MIPSQKSLFSRIFCINLLIIFLAFSLVSIICYSQLYAYIRNEQRKIALTASSSVYELADRTSLLLERMPDATLIPQESYRHFRGSIEENYHKTLRDIATLTGISLLQIAPDHRILYRYADIRLFESDVLTMACDEDTGENYPCIHPPSPISDLLSGTIPDNLEVKTYQGETFYLVWGTMEHMYKKDTLTVMKPIYASDGETVSSLLVLFIPLPRISYLLDVLGYKFIFAVLISLIISVILSYALSYRIARPLKSMNEAAKKLASGDFAMRVDPNNSISEIDELIATFNDMAEALENAEENQRSFTASIAHELRTPMTSIIGFIDSILDGTIPKEDAPKYLKICLSEARRLSRLVNELMDVTRIERGIQKLDYSAFDVNECIRRQIIKYEEQILTKKLDVSCVFDQEKCLCYCDKDAITRVVINLIDNAIKFTREGGRIHIDVSARAGKACIAVENSGEGIAEEDIKHVFDKFYKSDKSRGLDKKGIGLGLYLVKNLLQLHNETIDAESIPGSMTRFSFTLPLYHGDKHK